jgi:methionine synthase II (cobalamin-independent)
VSDFVPELRSLSAGSLPHTDPAAACQLVLDTLDIPSWPQLPKRSFHENMYVQYSERFPGVVVANERILVDRNQNLDLELEQLYFAYLMNDTDYAAISPDYAAGLQEFLSLGLEDLPLVKGQVTGPVSWGLTVVDGARRPVLYDDVLAEAVSKLLRLKASWEEEQLKPVGQRTIIFVDEPYMSGFGSALISLGRDQVHTLLEEVFAGIDGLKGVHCCGNTDWSLLLSTSADILNLDAYEYAEALALYPDEVASFLERGGVIAWGIIPANDRAFSETVESLVKRWQQAIGLLAEKGIHPDDLMSSALITPSCGCGSLTVETAERVLTLTGQVSRALRERYA